MTISATDKFFFDTDCLSTFIKVRKEHLLFKLFEKIYIPYEVYDEIKLYKTRFNKMYMSEIVDKFIKSGKVILIELELKEQYMFVDLIYNVTEKYKIIGKGEASVICLAKYRNGVIASNNMNDIAHYINKYNLKYTTTSLIIHQLVLKNIINTREAEEIWSDLVYFDGKINPFKMPYYTYKDFLKSNELVNVN